MALLTIAEGDWGIRLPITNFMENGQAPIQMEELGRYKTTHREPYKTNLKSREKALIAIVYKTTYVIVLVSE